MRQPTWAVDFPRFYELYCDSDTASEANYFKDFENALNMWDARPLEEDLQQLDDNVWRELKQKAVKYVATRDNLRAYEQLFNTLSEIKGYLYLKSEGCTEVHFIPEENTQTPDLYGCRGSSGILMEVKTINISDEEIDYLKANSELRDGHMKVREVLNGLSDLLKNKIINTIKTAKNQLMNYPCKGVKRRIVYLIIKLDMELSLDASNFDKLADYINQLDNEQIEVKYCRRGWQT